MDPEVDDEIILKICKYAEDKQLKLVLKQYLKRLILEKPTEPIKFLLETISENPFIPSNIANETSIQEPTLSAVEEANPEVIVSTQNEPSVI